MSAVWISKASWDKVWSALHNIRIRQDFTVRTPSAGITGTGSGARLQIDLPGTASSGEPGKTTEYAGYFKLYLIKTTVGENTTYQVRIADGATYQSETSVGGNSTAKVNNTIFTVAPYLSASLTVNTLFYLKYDHSAGTVTIESSSDMTLPSDTDTTAYYQLGRYYKKTSPPVEFITQDHSTVGSVLSLYAIPIVVANGIPQIWWMKNEC